MKAFRVGPQALFFFAKMERSPPKSNQALNTILEVILDHEGLKKG
jgi:hypothetical protein